MQNLLYNILVFIIGFLSSILFMSSENNSIFHKNAICVLKGDNISGNISFIENEDMLGYVSTNISGVVSGLKPGKHGFHIHMWGDQTNGCQTMGSHYNPSNDNHGGIDTSIRHAGDLGNIIADKNGFATIDICCQNLTINEIIGRGLVVHDGEDDLGMGNNSESHRTGNAGKRVACGVISLTSSDK